MTKYLIVCDLDNTLIGADASRFGVDLFRTMINQLRNDSDDINIGYASGRSALSMENQVNQWYLPIPDILISNVGTDVRRWDAFISDPNYSIMIQDSWEFSRLITLLKKLDLDFHPEEYQTHNKISINATSSEFEKVLNYIRSHNLKVRAVYSSDKNLDIIPIKAGKGNAVEYVRQALEIEKDNVIVAGDSGNDRSMFRLGYKGIVVNNAIDNLKAVKSAINYISPYDAVNGVIDGLKHWEIFK